MNSFLSLSQINMSDIDDISVEGAAPSIPVVEIGTANHRDSPRDHSDEDYNSEFE